MDKTLKRYLILVSMLILFIFWAVLLLAANDTITVKAETIQEVDENSSTLIYIDGITAANRPYDGTVLVDIDYSNAKIYDSDNNTLIEDDDLSIESITGTIDSKNAGSHSVSLAVKLIGENSDKYQVDLSKTIVSVEITPKSISISSLEIQNRIYNGTTNISLQYELDDVVPGDIVYLEVSGNVSSKIGNALRLQDISTRLGGIEGHIKNYSLQPLNCPIDVNITQKPIAISSLPIINKTYDGTDSVNLVYDNLDGVVSGDMVKLRIDGSIEKKDVANNVSVTLTTTTLEGDDALYYYLESLPHTVYINVIKKDLTISGVEAEPREYNGSTDVEIKGGVISGVISGDSLSVSLSGKMANKDVGSHKEIISIVPIFSGRDANNYTLTLNTSLYVDIYKKPLSIAQINAKNKTYDGTTRIEVEGGDLSGLITNDQVKLAINCDTLDANVGTNKAAMCSFNLTGIDAHNYDLPFNNQVINVTISKRTISMSNLQAINREYDATCDIELIAGDLINTIAGDDVRVVMGYGRIINKDVGVDKGVEVTLKLEGDDALNYSITQPQNVTVSIYKRKIWLIGVTAEDKEYDGKTNVKISGGLLFGVCSEDIEKLGFTLGEARFEDKRDGINKKVLFSAELVGEAASNYELIIGDEDVGGAVRGTIYPNYMFARVISWILFVLILGCIGGLVFLIIRRHSERKATSCVSRIEGASEALQQLKAQLEQQKQINVRQASEFNEKYTECFEALKYVRKKNSEYVGVWRNLYPQIQTCESLIGQMPTFIEKYSNDTAKCKQYMDNLYSKIQIVITTLNSITFE